MEAELHSKLENYIEELDHMSALLNSFGFSSDAALVYSEVSKKLKTFLEIQ